MQWFDARVMSCTPCGGDVLTCRLERPAEYHFVPGQHFMLKVPAIEGPRSKPFSHAAAPGDSYLEMTTRLSGSPFKQALRAAVPGDVLQVSSAAGSFVLPAGTQRVVFLVGGVGITPAWSMVRDAVQRNTGLSALIVYGNRDETCIPYRDELEGMLAQGIAVVHVLEAPSEGWTGHRGFITPEVVRALVDPQAEERYVVAGPPAMVTAMDACLDALGVSADRRLVERFSGYA